MGLNSGYRALREEAGFLDLSGRGLIRVTGEDQARLLHAMTTNDVEHLKPGQGCYAFFLNAQGRILADLTLLCFSDYFLLETEPEKRQFVYEHMDKYIIADDVTLEDVTDETAVLAIEGPRSDEALSTLDCPVPTLPYSHIEWQGCTVARITYTGQPGYRIFAPLDSKDRLVALLESAGVQRTELEDARTVRIEQAKPRYGEDISDRNLPQETQLLHAIHFNKGCYLGQEIVERIRSRGMVHRHLVPIEISVGGPMAAGTKLKAAEAEAGEIASSVYSPGMNKVVGLAYVRTDFAKTDAQLTAGEAEVRVRAPKPWTV